MRYSRLIELIAAFIATVLNMMLIPIILTKSSPKMSRYKYLLLAYTVSACYFVFAISTALFTWYLPENGFLFMVTVNILPGWLQQAELISFCSCYVVTLVIIDCSFVYRLSVIDGSSKRVAKLRYVGVAMFGAVFIAGATLVCGVLIAPLPETERVFRGEVLKSLDLDLGQIGYIGGQITINGHINMGLVALMAVIGLFVSISFAISIVCWYRIGAELSRLQNMRDMSYRLHRKCYLLLTLQTCVPVTFNLVPVGVIIMLYFLNISYSDVTHYCAMVLSFAQILDPLFTIFFIVEYKRFLLNAFKKFFKGSRIGIENTTQTSMTNQRITSNTEN